MSLLCRRTILVASLVTVLFGSSLAQAKHIRSVADRRQHPNGSFFEKSNTHRTSVVRPMGSPVVSARSR